MLRTVITQPKVQNKHSLFRRGKELIDTFCELNSLPLPHIEEANLRSTPGTQKGRQIKIDLSKCTDAVFTKNTNYWSFPGHIIDNTPYGECCRQFGQYLLHKFKHKDPLQRMLGAEKILGYEKTDGDAFAEAARLYLTNSNLLKTINDKRYWALRTGLWLTAIIDDPWGTVLQKMHSPHKYIKMIQNTYSYTEKSGPREPLITELTKGESFEEIQIIKVNLLHVLRKRRNVRLKGFTKKGKPFSLEISCDKKAQIFSIQQQNLPRPKTVEQTIAIHAAHEFLYACLFHVEPLSGHIVSGEMVRRSKTRMDLNKMARKLSEKGVQ